MYKKDFKLNGNGKTESRWTTQSILKTVDALLTDIAKEDKRTKSAIIEIALQRYAKSLGMKVEE